MNGPLLRVNRLLLVNELNKIHATCCPVLEHLPELLRHRQVRKFVGFVREATGDETVQQGSRTGHLRGRGVRCISNRRVGQLDAHAHNCGDRQADLLVTPVR